MSNSSQNNYNENSIDSKITLLLTQQQDDAEDRREFRKEILNRLNSIETQTKLTNGRVTKLEETQKHHVDACSACRLEIKPILDAAVIAKSNWFTLKNIALFISFATAVGASLVAIFGK
jgi:uncharacterized protein with PIN domain